VVLTLLLLLAVATIPSALKLFAAGANAQAYNLLNAQLKSARAHAVGRGTYAAAHVQMGKVGKRINECYTAVMQYSWTDGNFSMASEFLPHRFPGSMAFGEISAAYVDGSSFKDISDADLDAFTTFSIVFTADGSICKYVRGENVKYNPDEPLFIGANNVRLWGPLVPAEEPGVTAVTMFDYVELQSRLTGPKRAAYLNEVGQILSVNIHTGQVLERE